MEYKEEKEHKEHKEHKKFKKLVQKHLFDPTRTENNFFYWKALLQEYNKDICLWLNDKYLIPKKLNDQIVKCINNLIELEEKNMSKFINEHKKYILDTTLISTNIKLSILESTKNIYQNKLQEIKEIKDYVAVAGFPCKTYNYDENIIRKILECIERELAMNIHYLELKYKINIFKELQKGIPKEKIDEIYEFYRGKKKKILKEKEKIKPLYFEIYNTLLPRVSKNSEIIKLLDKITSEINEIYVDNIDRDDRKWIEYLSTLKYIKPFIIEIKGLDESNKFNIDITADLRNLRQSIEEQNFKKYKGMWENVKENITFDEYIEYLLNLPYPRLEYILEVYEKGQGKLAVRRYKEYIKDKFPKVDVESEEFMNNIIRMIKRKLKVEEKEEKFLDYINSLSFEQLYNLLYTDEYSSLHDEYSELVEYEDEDFLKTWLINSIYRVHFKKNEEKKNPKEYHNYLKSLSHQQIIDIIFSDTTKYHEIFDTISLHGSNIHEETKGWLIDQIMGIEFPDY